MPDQTVAEDLPDRCVNGHQLGAGRMIVAWTPCGCTPRRGHRTVTCNECGVVWYRPEHVEGGVHGETPQPG